MSEKLLIKHDIENEISTITLDDSRNYNAFSEELIKQFMNLIQQIQNNEKVKIVVLKASGKHFSAGADLNSMQSIANSSKESNYKSALFLANLFSTLYHLKKPVIALVQGKAFGGALGLIACCDIVITQANAQFCFSEVKLGLIPATISPYVIQKIGISQARRLFISAEMFDAPFAKSIGLVHHICDDNELDVRANQIVNQLLQNSPAAMAKTKVLLERICPIDSLLIEDTAEMIANIRASEQGQEGLRAFLEKRKPNWVPHE